ncbi:NAD(P)-dependent oxidoreductase [Zunongwangia sp. F363]|uniref:NAD(P)-dependent oxidoreductase n=1 Tax=Autumnicola tepida TaxID=3075595 RepID=A0ABU3CED0_9FLAO|nr:NAD(P)-dependent oxidoreductase [Zunongwangia sp. F363]MDT0644577.1 NAD(P)-dependent oxidoreductase [Zunongwangia sp. F363]
MKYLIFGGTGLVGKKLAEYIVTQGDEVKTVSRSGNDESIALDIREEEEFNKLDFYPDVIINCASQIPVNGRTSQDPFFLRDLFETNVVGAVNIANWAVRNKISKIINCSTLVVVKKPWPDFLSETYFGIPDGPHVGYCMSKLCQEQIMSECVVNSQTKLLHARISAVYGEEMLPEGLIFNLLQKLENNEDIILTDGNKNTVDLIHVEDVSRSLYALSDTNFELKILNLASGKQISILNLAFLLKELTGSESKIINHSTNVPASTANISVEKLKGLIGDKYNNFIPLEEGLKSVIGQCQWV